MLNCVAHFFKSHTMTEETNYCFFIGEEGLFKVFCVFFVICVSDVHKISQGDIVPVAKVTSSKSGSIVYQVHGEYYYHHNFRLYRY